MIRFIASLWPVGVTFGCTLESLDRGGVMSLGAQPRAAPPSLWGGAQVLGFKSPVIPTCSQFENRLQ